MPMLRGEAIEDAGQRGVHAYAVALKLLSAATPKEVESVARRFAARHVQVLRRAELFYVNSNMLALAVGAGRTLDSTDLHEADLPAEEGLIYFSDPIDFDDGNAEAVCAASWSIILIGDERALLVTWFTSADEIRRLAQQGGWNLNTRPRKINQALCTMWRFGNDQTILLDGRRTSLNETPEGRAIGALFSVWHLMRQTLAATTDAHYDRASIRRLARENREPERVRVIELRRRMPSTGNAESDREYHHQWIVRGHWRKQWYPSLDLHRPVWIAPHVKGPEDAPLLGGEKVYALKR